MDSGSVTIPTGGMETRSLDIGLNDLGMLSTVTNARQDYLNEMRVGRARSHSCTPLWGTEVGSLNRNNVPPITKENFGGVDRSVVYSVTGCHLNKMLQKRSRKNRISPYCRRKPLSTVISPSFCRSSSGTGSPTTSLSSEEGQGDRGLTPITQLFQEHLNLRQTHSTHPLTAIIPTNLHGQSPNPVSDFPDESFREFCHLLKMKTDSDSFPIPVLTRSKSLEDLRESIKPKTKSLSSYVCGCGGVSSVDVSLSPRFSRGKSGAASYVRLRSRLEQNWSSLDSENIKSEIDAMSMRIQKLDVDQTWPSLDSQNNIKVDIDSMSMRIQKLDVA